MQIGRLQIGFIQATVTQTKRVLKALLKSFQLLRLTHRQFHRL